MSGVPLGDGGLYTISRGNGAQLNPRPAGGRQTFSGLAFDGNGLLWGSDVFGAMLNQINPATGIGVPAFPIPAGMLDLASDPCASCVDDPPDLGDAPDSTNHTTATMTAYAGVTASFPTVRDIGTGAPPGPFHRLGSGDSWLGPAVTAEQDADQLPDADGVTNIDPLSDTSDRDGADDGVSFPISLPPCQTTSFNYVIRVLGGTRDRYTNVWFDFNRNGQWGDTFTCVDSSSTVQTVHEWAVQDQLTTLGPGTHTITTPLFYSVDPGENMWMRITLGEIPSPAAGDGSGYEGGYEIGETEDYLIFPRGGSLYE